MINHFFGFLQKLTFAAWIEISLPLLIILLAFVVKKYLSQYRVKYILYFILLVSLFRAFLFYNPFSWALYRKLLPLKIMDWRQYDELVYESMKYLKPNPEIKYLAVGASQTQVIYYSYSKMHDDLLVFSLAGLSPLDLYTFRNEILRLKPKKILLYISEMDIARNPILSSSKWSPFSFNDIREIRSVIDTTSYFTKDDKQVIEEIFFGKFLPEFKYSFIYKNILNRVLNEQELYNNTAQIKIPDSVSFKIQMKELSELSDKYIPFNAYYLNKAFRFFNDHHIPLIVVEGQYNPKAYNAQNLKLNEAVRKLVKEMLNNNPINSYITREELYLFKEEDYKDGYHVKREAGFNFSENLVKFIELKYK